MKYTKDEIRRAMLLYAVTDRKWLEKGEKLQDIVKEVLENGATFLQLREKDISSDLFETEAIELRTLCAEYGVPFVVNDNVEIAIKCNADGVHVGQSDIKGRNIRNIIGEDKILGISAGTVEEAISAEKAGADYIGVGAVFGTSTKKEARTMTLELLKEITEAVTIPVVAIGGIVEDNIMQLKGCGVSGVAVVSAIFGVDDAGKATAGLLKLSKEMVNDNG